MFHSNICDSVKTCQTWEAIKGMNPNSRQSSTKSIIFQMSPILAMICILLINTSQEDSQPWPIKSRTQSGLSLCEIIETLLNSWEGTIQQNGTPRSIHLFCLMLGLGTCSEYSFMAQACPPIIPIDMCDHALRLVSVPWRSLFFFHIKNKVFPPKT